MADKTKIEWTDATWNPLRGCSRVSEGCRNCYAEGVANRFKGPGQPYEGLIAKGGQWNGEIRLVPELLDQPLRWRKPRRIFVNSTSDLFHENVPDEYIDKVFAVMALAHWHTFQILTKRPERMASYCRQLGRHHETDRVSLAAKAMNTTKGFYYSLVSNGWALPNVWLGVSVEDQATANARIPLLLDTPAAVRWISAEPLLGPVDLAVMRNWISLGEGQPWLFPLIGAVGDNHGDSCSVPRLDWVVVGGESGPSARPMHPDWVRSLRDQCTEAGVAFLMKQWGEWANQRAAGLAMNACYELSSTGGWIEPSGSYTAGADAEARHDRAAHIFRVGKKAAGRLLDGITHDNYPDTTAVRLEESA